MNAKTKGARILMVFIMIYLLIPLVVTIIYLKSGLEFCRSSFHWTAM